MPDMHLKEVARNSSRHIPPGVDPGCTIQHLADMNAGNSSSMFHSNSVVRSHNVYKRIGVPLLV